MTEVKVAMQKEKETKNTFRYQALEEDSPIPTLYINKSAIAELGDPDVITIVVS